MMLRLEKKALHLNTSLYMKISYLCSQNEKFNREKLLTIQKRLTYETILYSNCRAIAR